MHSVWGKTVSQGTTKAILLLEIIFLLSIGCAAPQSGQWYEHKGTRERIQITNTGYGWKLAEITRKISKEAKDRKSPITFFLSYDEADSTTECVSFDVHHPGLIWWKTYVISVEKLKQDYSRVE